MLHLGEIFMTSKYRDAPALKISAGFYSSGLKDEEKMKAWAIYWAFWVFTVAVSSLIFWYVHKFPNCQPFLGACLYQDYIITLAR